VKRQRAWFRRDPRVRWLDAAAPDLVSLALLLARTRSHLWPR
jgi:tRNA dimethylallyltransferase